MWIRKCQGIWHLYHRRWCNRPGYCIRCSFKRIESCLIRTAWFLPRHFFKKHQAGTWRCTLPATGKYQTGDGSTERKRCPAAEECATSCTQPAVHCSQLQMVGEIFYGIGLKIYMIRWPANWDWAFLFLSKEETLKLAPTLDPEDLRAVFLSWRAIWWCTPRYQYCQDCCCQRSSGIKLFSGKCFAEDAAKRFAVFGWKTDWPEKEYEVKSKVVINATGVFTDYTMKMDDPFHENIIRPSQGIHLVVDKEFLPGSSAIMRFQRRMMAVCYLRFPGMIKLYWEQLILQLKTLVKSRFLCRRKLISS